MCFFAARARPRRAAVTRLLPLAAALCVAAGPSSAPAAAAPPEFFGINAGGVLDLPAEQREAHLSAMAAAGMKTLRLDASWSSVQPTAPNSERNYRWDGLDAIAGAFARHGMRWYPVLAYSTEWSGQIAGDVMSAPAGTAAYAEYARSFAARYGTGGSFWAEHPELPALPTTRYEIWNEPNARMFWRSQDTAPEQYAELYVAARAAIKTVDPGGLVVTGGLLDANASDVHVFLQRMVRHRPELRSTIDAVGYHPYQYRYASIIDGIRRFRRTMDQVGLAGAAMEITEIGITTAWVSEGERAATMSRLARELPDGDEGVTRFLPFVWLASDRYDDPVRPAEPDHWWGMVRRDLRPTATATAYLAAMRLAQAAPVALATDRAAVGRSARISSGAPLRTGRAASRQRGARARRGGPCLTRARARGSSRGRCFAAPTRAAAAVAPGTGVVRSLAISAALRARP